MKHTDNHTTAETIRIVGITATGQIPPYARLVKIMPDLGAISVAMPNAVECPGEIIKVMVADVDTVAAGATTAATLTDGNGNTLFTLDADADACILWSDGETWNVLVDAVA